MARIIGTKWDAGDVGSLRKLNEKTIHPMRGSNIDALDVAKAQLGLVSRYAFGGNGNDSYGTKHLTAVNAPTYVNAVYGLGADLTASLSQYFQAGNTTDHDVTTNNLWVSFFWSPKSVGSLMCLVGKCDSTVGTNKGWQVMQLSNGKIDARLCDGSAPVIAVQGNTVLQAGATYWILVKWDRVGNVTIYVDAVQDGSGSISAQQLTISNNVAFKVGASGGTTPTDFADGYIDHLQIGTVIPTDQQIKQMFTDLHAGQLVFATTTENDFVANNSYYRDAENTRWEKIWPIETDESIYPHSTAIGDYSTPVGVSVSSVAPDSTTSFTDDYTATTGWTQTGASSGGIAVTGGAATGSAWEGGSTSNQRSLHKSLGVTLNDEGWRADFEYQYTDEALDGTFHILGLVAGTSWMSDNAISQDALSVIHYKAGGVNELRMSYKDGTSASNSGGAVAISSNTTYYLRFERISTTQIKLSVFTDAGRTTHATGSPFTFTIPATVTGLTHIHHANTKGDGTGNTLTCTIDNVSIYNGLGSNNAIDDNTGTYYKSTSEVNPWLRVELSASADKEPSAIALYPHASTTATELLIQVSPDGSAWTTVRTISVPVLTMGAWNYIRFNRPTQQIRYVRVYGNDGTAKVLAISEIKTLSPTESQWNRRHGHALISASINNLPLSG